MASRQVVMVRPHATPLPPAAQQVPDPARPAAVATYLGPPALHANPFRLRSKSQIQTYLEQNEGPGLQHVALKTDDIFSTMRKMRAV